MIPDPVQLLVHAIGFALLVWLLKRFAWGPLLGVLDQRRRQIASGLDDIVRAKQEMGRLKTQYERELGRIEESARQKLVEAVNQGRRLAAEIEEEARARAQLELLKAKETLALEVVKAKTVLRDQIVTMALEASEKLLRSRLDETKDRALIEQFIAELDEAGAAAAPNAKVPA